MAEVRQPYVHMFTVCDRVLVGSQSGTVTKIIGIRDELMFDEFPAEYPLRVYARFQGGDGAYKGVLETWWMGPPCERLDSHPFEIEITPDTWLTDRAFRVQMTFDRPGFYEFRIAMENCDYVAHPLYVGLCAEPED